MSFIQLKNVHKKYGNIQAVENISFEGDANEFLVILGPSGAGKTSTLKMIAGLESVSSGEIRINGELVNEIPPEKRQVAMVFETYALYPHLRIFENIAFPLRSKANRISRSEIDKRVHHTAKLLQIEDLLDRSPSKLSGGQKQRVSFGRALVRETSLLLMDEPLSHLDAKLRHHMRRELKKIQRDLNTTFIYVTHDYVEALALADRLIVLIEGQIHQIGDPSRVYNAPADIQVASLLGQPKINLLPGILTSTAGDPYFITDDESVKIPVRTSVQSSEQKVWAGIRAQFIRLSRDEDEAGIRGEVYVTENLGRRNLLGVRTGEHILNILTDTDIRRSGQTVKIRIPSDKLILFDAETGKNIDYHDKS